MKCEVFFFFLLGNESWALSHQTRAQTSKNTGYFGLFLSALVDVAIFRFPE